MSDKFVCDWDDVFDKIKEIFEKIGIFEVECVYLVGVFV